MDSNGFLLLSLSWKKIGSDGVGEMGQWLRVLTDLSEDQKVVTPGPTLGPLTLTPRDLRLPSGLCGYWHAHMLVQPTHIKKHGGNKVVPGGLWSSSSIEQAYPLLPDSWGPGLLPL